MPPKHERLLLRLALVSIVLACAVLLNEDWVRAYPIRSLLAQLAVATPLTLGLWVEWRSGLLSVPLRQLPEQLRRRGQQVRPIVGVLQTVATLLFLLVLFRLRTG